MITFDIESAVASLGLAVDVHGIEANGMCPMHEQRTGKQDRSPSWWINLQTGAHVCFSCGYKGNIAQLVCDVKGFYSKLWGRKDEYDYAAANQWLASCAEITPDQLAEILKNLPQYIEPTGKPMEMSEARLAIYVTPPADVCATRGITSESADKYGVMWDATKKAWILPLRDPHFQKLMGWQEKGTVERTFFNRPAGLQRSKTLFGVENQKEECVVVVESPLDCLKLESVGVSGAVAVCGSSLSEEQIKLLRYSNKIIAAFDNDSAGRKASKEMFIWGRKYGLNLFFFNYGSSSKKDPGDMTAEEIHWGLENAQSALLGESAYVQRDSQALPS